MAFFLTHTVFLLKFLIPVSVLDWLRAHFGTWSINIGANTFKISIAYGKIGIGGQPITLTASDNINYPTNGQPGGWVKFYYASTVYYIHFPTNIEWVGFTGGNPGAGSLPNQGKQVPAYGKMSFIMVSSLRIRKP